MAVPMALRPLIGRAEVTRSLGTSDGPTAERKAIRIHAELQAEWAKIERGSKSDEPLVIAAVCEPT